MNALLSRLREATRPKQDDRLALLAVGLGLAGAQVLQDEYGWTPKQTAEWLDKMLDKAKVNRASSLAIQAVKEIDGGRN